MTPLDPACEPDCPTCHPVALQPTLDAILELLTQNAIAATRAGATTDQIDAAARRGHIIASPHLHDPDPKSRPR